MNPSLTFLQQYGQFVTDISLKSLTTLHIGGGCLGVLYPDSVFSLKYAIETCNKYKIHYKILGNGSNILASDDFYEGIIIKLTRTLQKVYLMDNQVFAEAGASLIALSHQIAHHGLSGLEWAAGIPATVGGACFMNAGAYLHCLSENITKVCILKEGEIIWLENQQCQFDYRFSVFQQHPDWIIVGVLFKFQEANADDIKQIMEKRQIQRMNSQPLQAFSCGSTFRNHPDYPTWKLIDECGLRGYSVGGAMVSPKHTNFLINNDQASFKDMVKLIQIVQQRVFNRFNIQLKLEVEQFNWTKTDQ